MKNLTRIVVFAIIAFSGFTAFAQKKFSGTIIYNIESVGETAIPLNVTEQSIKLFNERMSLNNGTVLVNKNVVYQINDLSQIQMFIQQSGLDFDYDGPWKFYIKNEIKQSTIDSIFLDGKYTITYTDETKDLAGITAKKAKITTVNDEDETTETEVWYTNEMGPEYDMVFNFGLKGFPLEFVQRLSPETAIKWTAKEVNKKKLKEAEFLLPAGYDEISMDKLMDFQEKLQEFVEDNNLQ